MHILYLDESGDPYGWNDQFNFVLGGISVHESYIYSITRQLNELQQEYFPGIKIPLEFHVDIIRRGRKKPYKLFSPEEREELIAKVYDIIAKIKSPGLVTFASSIHLSAVENRDLVCKQCFTDVCTNFNHFLYNEMIFNQKRGMPFSKGLLIIDRGREKRYREHYHEIKTEPGAVHHLPSIVDVPYFSACAETRMLQVSDFISNAVYRYLERNITQEFDKIKNTFYQGTPEYPCSGFNHITNDACTCMSCQFKKANGIK